ncbi:MAG: alkaline phosphatase D family protein [Ferruginibacter sp.]
MKNIYAVLFLAFFCNTICIAQKSLLKSGPWAGNVEYRTAEVWFETTQKVESAEVRFFPVGHPEMERIAKLRTQEEKDFYPTKIALNGLEINTTYKYLLYINGKKESTSFLTKFTTKDIWQFRKPAPDFNFLAGSCTYFNQPEYDRPGKPYGNDSSIFETMAKTPAFFNVWLGDNWYTREVDYSSPWGLNYRPSLDRSRKILQPLFAAMPQYSIWDDHDFGPNDGGKSYIFKKESRDVFMSYSLNPSYGEDGKGIYTKVSYSDVDIFLTDNRYFRSEPDYPDSTNGKENTEKTYFGPAQMEWLKNSLINSKATFKIITSGSQVLNKFTSYDCMVHYEREYNELMNFLASQKITGVIFLSGDRHHSEIIKLQRPNLYSLYDVTCSPLTSGVGKVRGAEVNNPDRVEGTLVEEQNFGNFSISGNKKERVLKVDFINIKGEKVSSWSVSENELK